MLKYSRIFSIHARTLRIFSWEKTLICKNVQKYEFWQISTYEISPKKRKGGARLEIFENFNLDESMSVRFSTSGIYFDEILPKIKFFRCYWLRYHHSWCFLTSRVCKWCHFSKKKSLKRLWRWGRLDSKFGKIYNYLSRFMFFNYSKIWTFGIKFVV